MRFSSARRDRPPRAVQPSSTEKVRHARNDRLQVDRRNGVGSLRSRCPLRSVVDSAFGTKAARRTTLYVTDSLLKRYEALMVDETEPGPPDKVRVRIIHLSPDAGVLNCYFLTDSGRRVVGTLPQGLTYRAVSAYVDVDSTSVSTDGTSYLRFFTGTDSTTLETSAAIPFTRGRSYAVVVHGLKFGRTLTVPDSTKPGGTTRKPFARSLSARVRATH